MKEPLDTEQKILEAAKKIFMQKGLAGARMQDIANEAGINKALLHYYYRSKEKLFELVFLAHKQKMFSNLVEILSSDKSVMEKVALVVEHEQDSLESMPSLPLFILNEMHQCPGRMIEMQKDVKFKDVMTGFFEQIKREIAEGKIRPINPIDLQINLISLNIFPYLAIPMFSEVLEMSEEEIKIFLRNRRQSIIDFMYHALKP